MYSFSAHISTESIPGLGMKHEELGQNSLIRISLNACIGPRYTALLTILVVGVLGQTLVT